MKKTIIIIIAVAMALSALGGGAYFYYTNMGSEDISERTCVASLFPLVVITQKTREFEAAFDTDAINDMIEDEDSEKDDGGDKAEADDPKTDEKVAEESADDSMTDADSEMTEGDATKEKPKKDLPPLISAEIDAELMAVAEKMTSSKEEDIEGMSKEEWLKGRMDKIVDMFQDQAPAYLAECKVMFDEVQTKCGSLASETEGQNCAKDYQKKAQELVNKHFPNLKF